MIISEISLRSLIRKLLVESNRLNELNPYDDRMTGGGAESFGKSQKGLANISDEDFIKAVTDLSKEFSKGFVDTAIITASFLDPTGIAAIPDIPPALMSYQKNKTLINLGLLILAILAAAPVAGKLAKVGSKGLKSIKGTLVGAKNVGKVPPGLKKVTDDAIKAIDEAAPNVSNAASKTSKIARIPKYGEATTIGYHGTSKNALENIKKHGLDNRVGRTAGEGLDAKSQGLLQGTVSNWTYTPESALDFASAYGDEAVLLRFDTASIDKSKGIKSNKESNTFMLIGSKEKYHARPKDPNDQIFHKYTLGNSPTLDHRGFDKASQQEVEEILSKLEFSKDKDFKDIVDIDQSKLSSETSRLYGRNDGRLKLDQIVGSAEVPVPPELISVSYDGGKTFSPLIK